MALIISSIIRRVRNIIGDRKITHGTFNSTSGAGSAINTGLEICEHLQLQGTANSFATGTVSPYVNANFPRSGTAVPIVSSIGGNWFAYGR